MLGYRSGGGKGVCVAHLDPAATQKGLGNLMGRATITPNWLWGLQRGERSIKNDHMGRASRPGGRCFITLWAVGPLV